MKCTWLESGTSKLRNLSIEHIFLANDYILVIYV
jgi:hypothetical protein